MGSKIGVTANSAGAVGVQPMVWGELRGIFLGLFHDPPASRGATRLHALGKTPQDPELHPPVLIKHLSSNKQKAEQGTAEGKEGGWRSSSLQVSPMKYKHTRHKHVCRYMNTDIQHTRIRCNHIHD